MKIFNQVSNNTMVSATVSVVKSSETVSGSIDYSGNATKQTLDVGGYTFETQMVVILMQEVIMTHIVDLFNMVVLNLLQVIQMHKLYSRTTKEVE